MRGNNKRIFKKQIKEKVQKALSGSTIAGVIGLSFIVVFREAFETVLFLLPFAVNDLAMTLVGGALGVVSALAISLIFFKIGKRLDVKRFFYFSSFLLIFFAESSLLHSGKPLHHYPAMRKKPPFSLTEKILHSKNRI